MSSSRYQDTSGGGTEQRKAEHIRICLEEQVQGTGAGNGLDRYRFLHNALPELDWASVSLDTDWLGIRMKAPLLVSSMTGGTDEAGRINRGLAEAAEARGWAIGLGSMRAVWEKPDLADSFRVRREAPSVPIIANVGAVQLNYGLDADACRRLVEAAEADALVLHLNSLQEVFQPEGDTRFSGLLAAIETLCRHAGVPVGVKEVGWGIDPDTAVRLAEAGASFIDAAGAGGTSWSQVEKHRSRSPLRAQAAEAFADWGIPTAESVLGIRRRLPGMKLIASGGLANGVEAAKAIALGADLAGYGRALLPGAASGADAAQAISGQMERIEFELRTAMFGIGAGTLEQLRGHERLKPVHP
ncbi:MULTISPECIES: type 2 isopentenyl-diphosphate Delta-isomerase [unclassified Paenibacillus]|uniref:type 2 isopentenyl-diphosphate Delta-isomerase n=1 Tax=unclassified Paenibacillus TaxID=185978 RepID=UPI000433F422|nr:MULTISPECIES: type 2 isopentenyl-diphosphate Delta-isomerase [unclassified Paenibacillus]KKC47327.1 isopentenyl pyrophosphate isomerase [Paenibacillus sp. D9]CDN42652.1 Isopentenyl-diphosphate delta-isomerase [Paenibacillus sp. P22]